MQALQEPAPPTDVLRFGDCELDLRRRELRRSGKPVRVQPTPLRLLLYLAEHRDRVVPRDELLAAIWPDAVVGDESVTRALKGVRRAVGDNGDAQSVISTQKGLGYRFVAPLGVPEGRGTDAPIEPRPIQRRTPYVAVAVLAVAAALVAGFLIPRRATPDPIRSLAVLPLTSLSDEPRHDAFADAMTDLLIAELSKLPGLRVVSRTSVLAYEGTKAPLREIAANLGVDGIVEGTVTREAQRVRITAQLIDARDDRHLWAGSYERALAHALEIQREVARAVAGEIEISLTPELARRLQPPEPVDPRALDAYVLAYALGTSNRVGAGSVEASIAALKEATRLAPDWAPAYSFLATTHVAIGLYWPRLRETSLAQARGAALRAAELDPDSGAALAARGQLRFNYDWDWAGAENDFRRAVELGFAPPQQRVLLAQVLLATGRTKEALALSEQATAEEPLDPGVRQLWAYSLYLAGEYEQALAQARHILALNPEHDFALFLERDSLTALGRGEEAVRTFYVQTRANPDITGAEEHERAWRSQGIRGIHEFWLRCYREIGFLVQAAGSATALGEKDEAFALLERAYQERDPGLRWLVALRQLAPLHPDPRFADLARRMNLPVPSLTDRLSQR